MKRSTQILIVGACAFAVLAISVGVFVTNSLQAKINKRMEKGWVLPPLELYSQGIALATSRRMPLDTILSTLERKGLNQDRDYFLREGADNCRELARVSLNENADRCLLIRSPATLITWDAEGWILDIWRGDPWSQVTSLNLFPELITQFYDGQPILQRNAPLSEIPLACKQAVLAIEDKDFLEHKGVSASGILRAMVRNLKAGRFAEGGSTITQQLVKNFFLTSKKTLRRKVEEQLLALLLESQKDKDTILEMYLNVIYMGQSGPYQVRGFGSAAHTYFDKTVSQLNLAECALLAAIINSPGRYSPFDKPDAASARRELVFRKMLELEMVNEDEVASARKVALPKKAPADRRTHAPYFVMSALREFESWDIDYENGARLYTTLDPHVQSRTLRAINKTLPEVEKRIKNPPNQPLQVAAIVADIESAEVLALVGGRDYRHTQFNRAIDSRRQIGSVVKPFVFYPALKNGTPLDPVHDDPFEWKVGRQVWKPKNYDGKGWGRVPLFWALAQSLNLATARLGQQVGLDQVSETLESSGLTGKIPDLPSVTLGALELSPMEVAQSYLTLARMGRLEKLHLLTRAEDTNGEILFEYQPSHEQSLDPATSAMVVGVLRQAIEMGTARAARLWGLKGDFAGKTGTTSDTKDAWFVGFNSRLLAVVWVGYDDNTAMNLTGASAALPVWVEIIKNIQDQYRATGFNWPPGVSVRTLSKPELAREYPQIPNWPEEIELIFGDWAS